MLSALTSGSLGFKGIGYTPKGGCHVQEIFILLRATFKKRISSLREQFFPLMIASQSPHPISTPKDTHTTDFLEKMQILENPFTF